MNGLQTLHTLADIFSVFLKIGICSIGGGYAVIGVIQEQAVEQYGWFGAETFADMIAISQMTPGPLAVNISTFVGMRLAGLPGAVAATVGCVTGGAGISILLYRFFQKYGQNAYVSQILRGLKAASLGLIASAAATIVQMTFAKETASEALWRPDWVLFLLLAVSFYLRQGRKWNPILIMLLTGVCGIVLY